ncbi:MAG: putative secretion protein [Xanthobacteraceae bacterium]|nr:putative secretion protein [Xanthobacteraceae bacterium]
MAGQFSQTTRSLASDTARYAFMAWAASGVLLVAWAVWFLFGAVTVYEVSKQARLEVRQAAHPAAALIAGKVVTTTLAIGKEVQAGDLLVELDASSERYRLREEEVRLQSLPREIASLRREMEARERLKVEDLQSARAAADAVRFRNEEAEAAAEFARETERRYAKLSATGGVSTVDSMRAATEAQKLVAVRNALASDLQKAEVDAKARAHQHDAQIETVARTIVGLERDQLTAQATVERLKVDIERYVIRATISGRIGEAAPLNPGSYVEEGQRLASIVPAGDLIVMADFSPSLTLGRVQPGQKGRLRLDGFPWAQFGSVPATVSRVASEIRDNFVRVEFTLDAVPASGIVMQHGLPGAIEVTVEEVAPVALVLRAAGVLLSAPTRATASSGATR